MAGAASATTAQRTTIPRAIIASGERLMARGRIVSISDRFLSKVGFMRGVTRAPVAPAMSRHPDSRVDEGIANVDQKIHEDVDRGDDDARPHDRGEVQASGALERIQPQPGPGKHGLGDYR